MIFYEYLNEITRKVTQQMVFWRFTGLHFDSIEDLVNFEEGVILSNMLSSFFSQFKQLLMGFAKLDS
jgi:hypothetical protein